MDSEWKLKMAMGKVPLVLLHQANDFTTWQLALRRLVTTYIMADALLYSVPSTQLNEYRVTGQHTPATTPGTATPVMATPATTQSTPTPPLRSATLSDGDDAEAPRRSQSGDEAATSVRSSTTVTTHSPAASTTSSGTTTGFLGQTTPTPAVNVPFPPHAPINANAALMASLGITNTLTDFFSSSTYFVDARDGSEEKEQDIFFRHEIWNWMESSLKKGTFAWIIDTVMPVFDIRSLYHKIQQVVNKATLVSHALEFRKVFTMAAQEDIFLYHSNLTKQIKLIKSQGESLGLDTTIPPWMEQSLLLIAAWQNPTYHKIALEYSTTSKTFTVDALVRELRNQNLVTGHLDKAGEKQNKRDAETHMPRYCYAFQKGSCTRNDCSMRRKNSSTSPRIRRKRLQLNLEHPTLEVQQEAEAMRHRRRNASSAERRTTLANVHTLQSVDGVTKRGTRNLYVKARLAQHWWM